MSWNLPDGCSDTDVDRASPGYWDEPEEEAPCRHCGARWNEACEPDCKAAVPAKPAAKSVPRDLAKETRSA